MCGKEAVCVEFRSRKSKAGCPVGNVRHKVAKDRLLRARTVAPAATSEDCKAKQDEQGGNLRITGRYQTKKRTLFCCV